jgi:chromate transport protein ChrA
VIALFWLFLKINLLSTSGIASVGLLHQEAVGRLLTQAQFVQAVSFSSVPPRDARTAMFRYRGGLPGPQAARFHPAANRSCWAQGGIARSGGGVVSRFVEGWLPVAVLMVYVAVKLVVGAVSGTLDWRTLALAAASAVAFGFDLAPPLVLLSAGVLGILVFR